MNGWESRNFLVGGILVITAADFEEEEEVPPLLDGCVCGGCSVSTNNRRLSDRNSSETRQLVSELKYLCCNCFSALTGAALPPLLLLLLDSWLAIVDRMEVTVSSIAERSFATLRRTCSETGRDDAAIEI